MKNLIKRNPRIFGFILLMGIVCGAYLACFVVGNFVAWLMPSDPRAISSPNLYTMFVNPVCGLFVMATSILICYLVVVIGVLLKILFDGTCNRVNELGQWLVKKTSDSVQEG
ncbi:hypothetical protein [Pseudomonas amygdali]|uniref:Uncharacterized protein n=1 Tax=Pseudomonas amygdali pv. lachrymans str. M301315 TaxID=629260 RepID=A0AAD0PWP8_PSEAV|nr:hypothetical protein [Pseudomonas amygdali]AXH60163.1 hypothetical protein PLA107_033800 [Pseudomonas amygdali pv. lachrymans str. M301315]